MNNDHQQQVVEICRLIETKGFVVATDGNVSVRMPNGVILATPTSMNKGKVKERDLVEVKIDGKQVGGTRKPSTELMMHSFIYRNRPDVNAVIHCHPVYATGFAIARKPLLSNVFPEVIMQFGDIPLAEYATPSTQQVGESLRPYIEKFDAVLLANHGVVTYGKDLWDAYYKMEKVEQAAHMLYVAQHVGGAVQLHDDEVQKLRALAKTIYQKNP